MSFHHEVRSFAAGALSPLLRGRSDLAAYGMGARTLTDAFGLPLGAATRRPGTYYSAAGKTAGKKVLLIPWIISATEGRILEVGHDYIRFYDDDGTQIENPPGTPVEVSSPWDESELSAIRYAQIGSYMYLVHPTYAPRKLTRTSDTSWALTTPTFTAGAEEETFGSTNHYPSLVEVYEDRLIFAATNANPGTFWGSRVSDYENFSLRRSAAITVTIAAPGVVSWTAHGLLANATVVFTTTGALPTGLTPGTTYFVVESSITANSFQVSATSGGAAITTSGSQSGTHTCTATPALDTDAWQKTPQAKNNNKILWLVAEQALLFGTSSGPFRVGGKEVLLTPSLAWWPTRQASVGSSPVQALMVDDFVAFVGRSGKRVYRFEYSQDVDKYVPDDISEHGEHLMGDGIVALAHQNEPITILWAITSDGTLLSGVYSARNKTIAWSDHNLSGTVESIAVIPSDGEDMVWVSVARTIGGSVVRHIEYLAPQAWAEVADCHYVDGGVVWDGGDAVTVTGITAAAPPVVTATAHGFANDDLVRFDGLTGLLDDNDASLVNGEVFTVKNKTDDTFELYTRDGSAAMDFSAAAATGTGGTVEQVTNTIGGLTHLEGEEVELLEDGAQTTEPQTVDSGTVNLSDYANKVHAGLPNMAIAEPMQIGGAAGRIKRIVDVYTQWYRTAGARQGPQADADETTHYMQELEFEETPTMDQAMEPQTKDVSDHWNGDYELELYMRFESVGPLPWTLLSVVAEVET